MFINVRNSSSCFQSDQFPVFVQPIGQSRRRESLKHFSRKHKYRGTRIPAALVTRFPRSFGDTKSTCFFPFPAVISLRPCTMYTPVSWALYTL
jgi:hypothetical protein